MSEAKPNGLTNSQLKHATFCDLNSSHYSAKHLHKKEQKSNHKNKINKIKNKKEEQHIAKSQLIAEQKLKASKRHSHSRQKSPSLSKDQLLKYNHKIRKQNKKFISRQNSCQNLTMRMPWGVNQPKLNNYVLETMAKMYKMRKADKKQQTFHTQRSYQVLRESYSKSEITPKKEGKQSKPPIQNKQQKYKIIKSPRYEEKTDKKTKSRSRGRISSEQKQTEKQYKNNLKTQQSHNLKTKYKKNSHFLLQSFVGEFQSLQKNNLYAVNYRIVKRKIIEIEVAIYKKVQSLTINLNKGSLDCQSINQMYENVMPKSSIILMSAVSGVKKQGKFAYPQLQLILNQKNGTFGMQKKIILPFGWIYLIQILSTQQLKQLKMGGKIKNKSIIDQIPYKRQILLGLQRIFDNKVVKALSKSKDQIYMFGYKYLGFLTVIKLVVTNNMCSIECESSGGGNTYEVLEMLQALLQI